MDECKNYTLLNEGDRSQGNTLQTSIRCDRYLVTGWYRFQGDAGDRMPNKCVLQYRCGTEHPGWLNGTHPTVAEGVVTRQVCYYGGGRQRRSDCCYYSNLVRVKNCSSYYVYELQKLSFSYPCLRYCGNAGAGRLQSISGLIVFKTKNEFKDIVVNIYKNKKK